jgi:hypothetical protein
VLQQNNECVFEAAVTVNFTRADISEIAFSLYDSLATSTVREMVTLHNNSCSQLNQK